MAEPHVITALVTKYREISGKLLASEKEVENLKTALSNLDATIRLFRTEYDTGAILPKRPYRRNTHFKKGVFIRSALDILREANQPMTARELAIRTLERQGISEPDIKIIEQIRRGLHGGLNKREKDGSVIAYNDTFPKRWVITR